MLKNKSSWFWLPAILLFSCRDFSGNKNKYNDHLAECRQPGYYLTVDLFKSNQLMASAGSNPEKTVFKSYLVSLVDSVPGDKKEETAKQKYFDYDLQKDWVALCGADTLYPVFFQGKPGLNRQVRQGVLVFEVPENKQIEGLIYQDSFGPWKTRQFNLTEN